MQIDPGTLPELAVCSADAGALAALEAALGGVLAGNSCVWWSQSCHDAGESVMGYGAVFRFSGDTCIPTLSIVQKCDYGSVDDCCDAAFGPPGNWITIAKYVGTPGPECEDFPLSLTLSETADGCGCTHGIDVSWPETLTVKIVDCDDATPGGDECGGGDGGGGTPCEDCLAAASGETELTLTITSAACPAMNSSCKIIYTPSLHQWQTSAGSSTGPPQYCTHGLGNSYSVAFRCPINGAGTLIPGGCPDSPCAEFGMLLTIFTGSCADGSPAAGTITCANVSCTCSPIAWVFSATVNNFNFGTDVCSGIASCCAGCVCPIDLTLTVTL